MKQIRTDIAKNAFLYKDLSYKLVGAFYNVRNLYGSGQKEIVYQNALSEELETLKIPFNKEVPIKIKSVRSGKILGIYKLDFVINKKIIVEAKALKFTPRKIEQQLYSYLKSSNYFIGYLVNFGSTNFFYKRIILTNKQL